jgi:hypothetical protein
MQRIKLTFLLNKSRDQAEFVEAVAKSLETDDVLERGDCVVYDLNTAFIIGPTHPVEVFKKESGD